MDEAEDQSSTDPAPAADNPLEMRTTPLGLFMARVLSHNQRLAEGDDPRDVDVAVIIETRKFLNTAGIRLPSDQCLYELSGLLDGKPPAYFNRSLPNRAASTRRKLLVAEIVFLVEALIFGRRAFPTKTAAARKVVQALNNAGILAPSGGRFNFETVSDWHELVMWKTKQRTDVERDMFDLQWAALRRTHPGHAGWDCGEALQWLNEQVKVLAGSEHFEKTKRKQRAGRGRKPPS